MKTPLLFNIKSVFLFCLLVHHNNYAVFISFKQAIWSLLGYSVILQQKPLFLQSQCGRCVLYFRIVSASIPILSKMVIHVAKNWMYKNFSPCVTSKCFIGQFYFLTSSFYLEWTLLRNRYTKQKNYTSFNIQGKVHQCDNINQQHNMIMYSFRHILDKEVLKGCLSDQLEPAPSTSVIHIIFRRVVSLWQTINLLCVRKPENKNSFLHCFCDNNFVNCLCQFFSAVSKLSQKFEQRIIDLF